MDIGDIFVFITWLRAREARSGRRLGRGAGGRERKRFRLARRPRGQTTRRGRQHAPPLPRPKDPSAVAACKKTNEMDVCVM